MRVIFDTERLKWFIKPVSAYALYRTKDLDYSGIKTNVVNKYLKLGLIELFDEIPGRTNPDYAQKRYTLTERGKGLLKLFEEEPT